MKSNCDDQSSKMWKPFARSKRVEKKKGSAFDSSCRMSVIYSLTKAARGIGFCAGL